jgi:hypothetical protein
LVSLPFSHELLPPLPPSPSHRPHRTGRCDGEGGRGNPPVEPELSTSAQFLDSDPRLHLHATSADRTLQGHAPGLVGCTRKQRGLAASRSVRPFGSVPSSIRVDSLIDHQVLHSFHNDSKPELGELTHLSHGALVRRPLCFRSLPPALSTLDSTLRPIETLITLESWLSSSVACASRRHRGKHVDLLGMHLCSGRQLAGLEILPQRNQQLSSQRHDP